IDLGEIDLSAVPMFAGALKMATQGRDRVRGLIAQHYDNYLYMDTFNNYYKYSYVNNYSIGVKSSFHVKVLSQINIGSVFLILITEK
ncbi:hypothetical protein ACJX0J_028750, partial [Zea mays]